MKRITAGAKPCPFCGNSDLAMANPHDSGAWFVVCNNTDCLAEGPVRSDPKLALEVWNQEPKRRK